MIRALIWKEWRQHRWKLVYGCVLLMGGTAVALRSRLDNDLFTVVLSAMAGAILMGLFVSMGLVAEDRGDGSLAGLLSLPVRAKTVFRVKMAIGAVVSAGPLVGAMIVSLVIAGGREITSWRIMVSYFFAVTFAWAMMVWVVTFSIRQDSEAKAAMFGIGLLLGWLFLCVIVQEFLEIQEDILMLCWTPLGLLASIPAGRGERAWEPPVLLAIQGLIVAGIFMVGSVRFERLSRSKR